MKTKVLDLLSAYNLQTQNSMVVINSLFASKSHSLRRRRRQHMRNIALLQRKQSFVIQTLLMTRRNPRKVWTKSISSDFWEKEVVQYDEAFFKECFRMSRGTFEIFCGKLKNLAKENTAFRKSIPLEKRVAVALYTFASPEEYRKIGNLFGIGKSTVCNILRSFCKEVLKVFGGEYLKSFPSTQDNYAEDEDSEIFEKYLLERDINASAADEKYKEIFAHLIARFARLGNEMENCTSSQLIKVGCVIQNFLNEHNDHINEDWLLNGDATKT